MTEGVNRSACRYPEAAAAAERLRQCVAAIRAELERVERMQKEFDSDIHPMNFQIYGKVAMAYRFARRALGESTEEAE